MNRPYWTYWDRDEWTIQIRWWKADLKAWLIHKLGGVTEYEGQKAVNQEHERWMKIILNPMELEMWQSMARAQISLIKKLEQSMYYGTGKPKKLQGLKAFTKKST